MQTHEKMLKDAEGDLCLKLWACRYSNVMKWFLIVQVSGF